MDFPKAYALRHKLRGTYIPHTNFATGLYEHIAEGNDPKYDYWYTNNLTLVKLWTTYKKIKPRITEKAAIYFDIVGTDGTIVPATELFK